MAKPKASTCTQSFENLPKDYNRPALDKTRLGQLIGQFRHIKVGEDASPAKNELGRVHDRSCGSAGMFLQSVESVHAHATGNGNGGKVKADISAYDIKSNSCRRLAKMKLAIRGIEDQITRRAAGLRLPRSLRSFGADEHGHSTSPRGRK